MPSRSQQNRVDIAGSTLVISHCKRATASIYKQLFVNVIVLDEYRNPPSFFLAAEINLNRCALCAGKLALRGGNQSSVLRFNVVLVVLIAAFHFFIFCMACMLLCSRM